MRPEEQNDTAQNSVNYFQQPNSQPVVPPVTPVSPVSQVPQQIQQQPSQPQQSQPQSQQYVPNNLPPTPPVKKKKNLKLIIGIIVAFVVVGIIAVIILKNFNGTGGGEAISKNEDTINKLIAESDNYIVSNFVDTNGMYRLKFPSEKTTSSVATYLEQSSYFYPQGTRLDIDTYIDGFSYIPAKSGDRVKFSIADYANGKELYEKFLTKVETSSFKVSYIESITINGIEWSKYSGQFHTKNNTQNQPVNGQIWVAISHNIPLVFKFTTLSYEDACGLGNNTEKDALCRKYVDNRENIIRYIIESLEFVDNKETLLNTFEAAVITKDFNNIALSQKYIAQDDNILSTKSIKNRVSNKYSNVYKNIDKISIDDVYNKIKNDLNTSLAPVTESREGDGEISVTAGDTYNISNKKIGKYTVKKYTIAKGSRAPFVYVYTFVIGDFYGYIGNTSSDTEGNQGKIDDLQDKYESSISIDSAAKNFYWSNDAWSLKDI